MVGATALMFHDRRATLSKMKRLTPPLQTSQVDYSLWLSRSPPEDLEHQRAAFIWWTSTHYKMRRHVMSGTSCTVPPDIDVTAMSGGSQWMMRVL